MFNAFDLDEDAEEEVKTVIGVSKLHAILAGLSLVIIFYAAAALGLLR